MVRISAFCDGGRRHLTFERWQCYLVACFLVYLAGFFIAPTGEFQLRWFYYTITPIAVCMLIFKRRAIFRADVQNGLKWFVLLSLLLFLPFLWTPDSDYWRSLRIGVERWLFVFSFALAVFYCARKPTLLEKWVPLLLIVSAGIALALLFYKSLSQQLYHNVAGMLLLSSNPNQTGMPLGVACILCLSFWFSGRLSRRTGLLWVALAGLFAVGVWVSTTRSAELGLVIAFTALLHKKLHSRLVWLLPLALLGVAVTYICVQATDPEHYMLAGREWIWPHIWESFKANPWFGLGAQKTYAVVYYHGVKLEAHSLYFGTAYYAGIFGLLVLFVLLWRTVSAGIRTSAQIRWIYFPLLTYGLAVHLFEGIYPVYHPHPFWLFTWLPIMALLLSKHECRDERGK